MANRRLAPVAEQPASFAFTSENAAWAQGQIEKYPEGRQASAVISLLWKAQEQHGGWLPQKAIEEVARMLGMAPIRVLEVATFYTMFALEPVGRFWIQLCGTVPCDVCGAKELKDALRQRIGPPGHVTPDGNFSWIEVECLGACCNAPMAQINHDYFEDLSPESLNRLLDDLAAGRPVKPGSQCGRRASAPKEAIRTLTDASLFDGSRVGAWRERFAETHIDGQDAGVVHSEEAASTTQRAKEEPKPALPQAGRATESSAADTPAVRAAEGERTTEPPTTDVADAKAVAADEVLRDAPPAQPRASGAEDSPPEGALRSEPKKPTEPERVRGVAASERIAAFEHERRQAEKQGAAGVTASAGTRPEGLAEARGGKPDDLKKINGIGPVSERRLNELGIYHLSQIAAWTEAEIRWVGAHLAFPGRIEREDWVGQAKAISAAQEG